MKNTKKAQEKYKKISKKLLRRLQLEKVVSQISSYFASIHASDFDKGVDFSLEKIVKFMNVDRGLFFLYSKDHRVISCCNEWHSKGSKSIKNRLQNLPVKDWSWISNKLKRLSIVEIVDIEKLPTSAKKEKNAWKRLGIRSLIVVRMITQNYT